MKNEIEIINYSPEHQPYFEGLNRAWIEKYFVMEPVDVAVLTQPDKYLLEEGGAILMACCKGEIIGTVALKKAGENIFEMTKMAVDIKWQGNGTGSRLVYAAIKKAKELEAKKIILYSQTQLAAAIHLYFKIGFKEIPLEKGVYSRCNIKMEIPV